MNWSTGNAMMQAGLQTLRGGVRPSILVSNSEKRPTDRFNDRRGKQAKREIPDRYVSAAKLLAVEQTTASRPRRALPKWM